MASDDWRIRVELPDEEGARGFLERLGIGRSDAEELAEELRAHRLAVSQDGDTVFVYTGSGMQAEQANRIIEQELEEAGLDAGTLRHGALARRRGTVERRSEGPDVEEDLLERGYAPWEVRVECENRQRGPRPRRAAPERGL